MIKNVLFCLVIRNAQNTLLTTVLLLKELSNLLKNNNNINSHFSIYENDSFDNTVDILNKISNTKLDSVESIIINSEKLNTKLFGSVKNNERVINLAEARNKCIFQFTHLQDVDKIIMVDVDFTWDINKIYNLIIKSNDFDIISPWSIYSPTNMDLYDKWATRLNKEDTWWCNKEITSFPETIPCWSVGNGFLILKADPFKNGMKYSAYSKVSNNHDCEHVVLCEQFREIGLNNIAMSSDVITYHFPTVCPSLIPKEILNLVI